MKNCRKCNIEKDINSFYKNTSKCKECMKKDSKHYRILNPEKVKLYNKQWNIENKEKRSQNTKKWIENNKERIRLYKEKNKERVKVSNKLYNIKNREKNKIYRKNNQQKFNNYINEYIKDRLKNDNIFKIKSILRGRLYQALVRGTKSKSSLILLGISIKEYKNYLESKFKPEMTWFNYGIVWEIDHIIPCSSFDLTKLEEQQKCFHYSNTQPLFITTEVARSFGYLNEIGNRDKSDKIWI